MCCVGVLGCWGVVGSQCTASSRLLCGPCVAWLVWLVLVGRYCPQFDALFEKLTVREHLQLYSRIKGLSEQQVGKQEALRLGALVIPHSCAGLEAPSSDGVPVCVTNGEPFGMC